MRLETLGSRRRGSGVFLSLEAIHLIGLHGEPAVRDVIRHPGGVGVLPVDSEDVILVRQYRVAVGRAILEIPAGKLDVPGEPLEASAARELEEETGYCTQRLLRLGSMLSSPGYTDEVIHLFAADGIVGTVRRPDGAEEHLAEVVRVPIGEALEMVDRGEIDDAKTQMALLLWLRMRACPG